MSPNLICLYATIDILIGPDCGLGLDSSWPQRDLGANLGTYQVGSHFEALDEGVLLVPLDPRCTQVGFNLIFVHVCNIKLIDYVF